MSALMLLVVFNASVLILFYNTILFPVKFFHVTTVIYSAQEWVSEWFINGTSAHYRLFSARKLKTK